MRLIMALQRSNELYKTIRHLFKRYKPNLNNNQQFTLNCIFVLLFSNFALWIMALLLTRGDIHQKPGPDSVESLSDSSTLTAHLNLSVIIWVSCIWIYKVFFPRWTWLRQKHMHMTQSWLKPEVQNNSVSIENFMPPHRTDSAGGGVIVYVRDSFSCRRRHDLEIRGIESVWVVKSKKSLIGGYYRPPNSNNEYFYLISESVDRAHNTNIPDIIITGDFNINMNSNNNKIMELIKQYNLKQLINEPTNFTENSASLIDLILVRNKSNILTSGVIDCFLPNQTRYPCPVLALLKFVRPSIKTFKRKVWNYHQAGFDRYRILLPESDLENEIERNWNIRWQCAISDCSYIEG